MWELDDEQLTRTFKFNSFIEAFAFMTKVALTAEKLSHYPTLISQFTEVTIRMGLHEEGDTVNDKDHFLAAAIDNIYGD